MADLWVVLGILTFFAVCVAFVRGCDLIIGPDDASDLAVAADDAAADEPATMPEQAGVR